ncbi:hypothetical protein BCT41_14060 [Vibrio splendidus]|uniref:O-antigen polymerase n=1 Tax=Vibrio splendidus TaxID=29497 RepID=UPI000C82E0B8|nr:O-antigen polymerase [Vibrio splendidus]PMM98507.1 hypothetical protein BCT41_14060 [Vibrio splendidus]
MLVASIYIISIIFFILTYRYHVEEISFAKLTMMYWFAMTAIPQVLAPEFYFSQLAFLYSFVSVGLLVIFFILGYSLVCLKNNTDITYKFSPRGYKNLSIINVGICSVIILINYHSSINLLNISDSIKSIAIESATNRYRYNEAPSLTISLALGVLYTQFALSGSYFASRLINNKNVFDKYIIISFSLLVTLSLLQNAKATILYGVVAFISGVLVWLGLINKGTISGFVKIKLVRIFVFILITSSLGMFYIQYTRYQGSSDLFEIANNLKVYYLGYFGGFSYWFDNIYLSSANYTLGWQSFSGLFGVFNLSDRGNLPAQAPKYLMGTVETNVDTLYSDLISDFGILGSLIFISFMSFILGLFSKISRKYAFFQSFLLLPYMTVLWSFTNSIANYVTVWFAYFIYVTIFYFFVRKELS